MIQSELIEYRKKVINLKLKKDLLEKEVKEDQESIRKAIKQKKITSEARTILSVVSSETQKRFIEYIEQLVTMGLQTVYGDDIKFIVEHKQREDSWECVMSVKEGEGEPYFPKNETGVGVINVISLTLRVVNWSIKKPLTRPLIILDEPMGAIGKGILSERAINMIRDISNELEIQFIVNTHSTDIVELADRAWQVTKKDRISHIEQIIGIKEKKIKMKRC